MSRGQEWLLTALAILAGVTYQYLVYRAASGHEPYWAHLALKSVPLLLLAWWVVARARHKQAGCAALLAAAGFLYWLDRQSFGAIAYGIPHAAIYLSLAWLFGHTLVTGQVPLITYFAQRVHGTLAPAMQAYTRRLTLAWTIFSVAQVAISVALFCLASREAWSLFITICNLPLVAAMFVSDYLYRGKRYPDHPRTSIAQAIRAFAEHTGHARGAAPGHDATGEQADAAAQ